MRQPQLAARIAAFIPSVRNAGVKDDTAVMYVHCRHYAEEGSAVLMYDLMQLCLGNSHVNLYRGLHSAKCVRSTLIFLF